jgi:6-pyruvoyltetrahydropterin/6-carboxytetrahydropterin synthase
MYTVRKSFGFSAAHYLPDLPEGHQCKRMHGHNYEVVLEAEAQELDDQGFVVDFAAFDPLIRAVRANLDHRVLNDQEPQPTAERLARSIYYAAAALCIGQPRVRMRAVTVYETPTSSAEYRP